MKNCSDLLVSIHCLAYNHAPFIRQCLEGFVMQKTNFRFEAVVHDDASIDGTTEIIKEYARNYPSIIKPILETENQWKKGTIPTIMKQACVGKYVAYCEGDDYWIDPYKLQKQVDALEANPKAMMCYSLSKYVNSNGDPIKSEWMDGLLRRSHGGDIFKDLLLGHFIMTATTVIRKEVLESRILKEAPCSLDYLNSLASAALGETEFIPEEMSCYRANPNGAMSTYIDKVQKSCDLLLKYFIEEYAKGNIKKTPKSYDTEIKKTIGEIVYRRAFYQLKDFSFLKSILRINKGYLLYVFWAFLKIKKENIKYRLKNL